MSHERDGAQGGAHGGERDEERDEEVLREAFQRLRAETGASGSVPDFAFVMARARAPDVASRPLEAIDAEAAPALEVIDANAPRRARPGRRRALVVGGWASVALAAAVAGILLIERGPDADEEFTRLVTSYATDAAAGSWRSPTAGLLEVPGMSLTRSMPAVGTELRGLDPTTRPSPRDGRDS